MYTTSRISLIINNKLQNLLTIYIFLKTLCCGPAIFIVIFSKLVILKAKIECTNPIPHATIGMESYEHIAILH